jgi:hypothetical protein
VSPRRALQATQPQPVGVAGSAGHTSVARSASTTVLSDAALRPARWRASSCRPKLGGALKTSHPPPRPHVRAQRHAGPSVDGPGQLVARAPCQLRRAHARSVRATRARLRQQRRLEVDKTTRRQDAQARRSNGGRRTRCCGARPWMWNRTCDDAGFLFLGVGQG